jgi:SAM-dependent methyltransferase
LGSNDAAWARYVQRFHDERAGITDVVLRDARHGDHTPYQWAVQPVGMHGPVVDLACGSAPLHRLITAPLCIGVDRSRAELGLAAGAGAGPLVLADAASIPLATGAAAAVVCSMSLQILQPLDRIIDQVALLLRPGGVFVALLPDSGPLTLRDRIRYAGLLVALRRPRLGYPNDVALANPVPLFAAHGLDVVSDERRRFGLAMSTSAVADAFVRSLYLPGVSAARSRAAARVARRWLGHELGIPIRRIVATRRR